MKRKKPYKYAIEKELAWLDEDIAIIDDELKVTKGAGRAEELRLRQLWAINERDRLHLWINEAKHKGKDTE